MITTYIQFLINKYTFYFMLESVSLYIATFAVPAYLLSDWKRHRFRIKSL